VIWRQRSTFTATLLDGASYRSMAIRFVCRVRDQSGYATFLYNFSDKDFGESSHDLGDRHGDLLTEALLNYLPRRRVRTWASRGWNGLEVVAYLSNSLLREGMTAICLKALILLRRKVVHEHPKSDELGLLEGESRKGNELERT